MSKSDRQIAEGYRRLLGLVHTLAEEQDNRGNVPGDRILSLIKREVPKIEGEGAQ
jgi:hypothetical protein